MTNKMDKKIAGIDVSKAMLDCNLRGQEKVSCWENDSLGCRQLGDQLEKEKVSLVVIEASGGYERKIQAELIGRGIAVAAAAPATVAGPVTYVAMANAAATAAVAAATVATTAAATNVAATAAIAAAVPTANVAAAAPTGRRAAAATAVRIAGPGRTSTTA